MNKTDSSKEAVLNSFGYKFSGEFQCYINKISGKIFTRAYVDDHDSSEIQNNIHSAYNSDDWKIFHNVEQTAIVNNILSIIGSRPKY
ncbi:MAG: hypothetical protein WC836_20135 [Desulfobacula sp.]|jgi:hypothetical protein